jgi:DNA-binding LacI/PurR family transcriptional regulator
MKKNITIKDVAKEAGVSVATVSYVINERTDKRISDKTRKKVLQVINLLGYTPNQSAKALATNRSGMVALYVSPNFSVLKNAEQLHLMNFLSSFLREKNYNLIYLSDAHTDKFDQADAILCYDLSSEYFHRIGDNNFAPLIALDCMINDPLFFQINNDYEQLAQQASAHFGSEDYALLLLDSPNQERKNYLESLFPQIIYVRDLSDIAAIPTQNLLVVEQTLYDSLIYHTKVCFLPSLTTEKAEVLFSCMENAIKRIPIEEHNILV